MYDVIIIGGGAAGIFASIATKTAHPLARVLVLEKKNDLLAKVRLTGGGRCNLTNACFTPSILAQNYPRGSKELLSAFHRFQPKDTIDWFTHRDVPLATEADGRVFPLSNKSDTIIQCLLSQAKEAGVEISLNQKIQGISKNGDTFSISIENGAPLSCSSLILATGSSAEGFAWAKALGHSIEQPIPSLSIEQINLGLLNYIN